MDTNPELPAWATEEIVIEEYNPVWPLMASVLIRGLKSLYDFKDAKFEHIGSTVVPDLVAKPIIDLMLAVVNFDNMAAITVALQPEDWHLIPPELTKKDKQRTFVKVVKDKRSAHLHLFLKSSDESKRHIDFRNLLRENSNLADDYAKLKTELAETFKNDREGYTNAKAEFIMTALKISIDRTT
jgi:GrpB-like predicted nucleotidyltransferase (UPF0157 family)